MIDKQADNKIYSSKEKINIIDDEIVQNKKLLKQFDDFQENTKALQRSLNRCVELLEQSVKGEKVNRMLADIKDRNIHDCGKTIKSIDDKILVYQRKISELNNQKSDIISEMRKENRKEENKDIEDTKKE